MTASGRGGDVDGPSIGVDGYLDVLRGKQDWRERDDSRFGLAGNEESRVNVRGAMIDRQ